MVKKVRSREEKNNRLCCIAKIPQESESDFQGEFKKLICRLEEKGIDVSYELYLDYSIESTVS